MHHCVVIKNVVGSYSVIGPFETIHQAVEFANTLITFLGTSFEINVGPLSDPTDAAKSLLGEKE